MKNMTDSSHPDPAADLVDTAPGGMSAVFVDRDNTLIDDPGYLRDPENVRLLDGVAEALIRLRDAGYPVIVVTNQSGIARGYLSEAELEAIHKRMTDLLHARGAQVDAIYYCPYLNGPDAVIEEYRCASDLRKPKPGMFLLAAKEMNIDLEASWMIGDSDRDMQAGRAAGCRTILIGEHDLAEQAVADSVAPNFAEAVDLLLRRTEWETQTMTQETPQIEPPPAKPDSVEQAATEAPAPDVQPEAVSQELVPRSQSFGAAPNDSVGHEAAVQTEAAGPAVGETSQAPEAVIESAVARRLGRPRPRPVETAVEAKLGEILEELRAIRRESRYADFSIAQLVGAIAQALALCAVGWGLYEAVNGETAGALLRILIGIAFQLMALTGFAFGRKK